MCDLLLFSGVTSRIRRSQKTREIHFRLNASLRFAYVRNYISHLFLHSEYHTPDQYQTHTQVNTPKRKTLEHGERGEDKEYEYIRSIM